MSSYVDAFGREVKVIVMKEKLDVDHLLGKFLDESHYDHLIDYDVDVYAPVGCEVGSSLDCTETDCSNCSMYNGRDETRIVAKFRKNFFSEEQQRAAYEGLRGAARPSQNRGLAAGPRLEKLNNREWVTPYQLEILEYFANPSNTLTGEDPIELIKRKYNSSTADSENRGIVWKTENVIKDNFKFEDWVESTRKLSHDEMIEQAKVVSKYISETTYANQVHSGIAGWYDRYPRIPYLRATSYTKENPELFAKAYPFLQTLNDGFKKLLPQRYSNQLEASKKIDYRYLVPGTVFSTITVNKTFRTAAHFDVGDLHTGLSNLLVLSNNGNYKGGYLVAPAYRAAFDVRPGDLLLINNHEVMHGNTPIELLDDVAERISVVCYLRTGMMLGTEKEYEDLRYEFVESRRKNPDHPLQRKLWNGVSEGMWGDSNTETDYSNAKEWYDFLKKQPKGDEYLSKYHPALKEANEGVSLEDFFA